MTLLHFNGNVLFEEKSNNQDLFVVILMLIIMCMANKYFAVTKFTYS